MPAAKHTFKLQAIEYANNQAALGLHNTELKLPYLPRPGDFIKHRDYGYAEIIRVVYDGKSGETTLVLR